jgi:hypothetical protein
MCFSLGKDTALARQVPRGRIARFDVGSRSAFNREPSLLDSDDLRGFRSLESFSFDLD